MLRAIIDFDDLLWEMELKVGNCFWNDSWLFDHVYYGNEPPIISI